MTIKENPIEGTKPNILLVRCDSRDELRELTMGRQINIGTYFVHMSFLCNCAHKLKKSTQNSEKNHTYSSILLHRCIKNLVKFLRNGTVKKIKFLADMD
jgi:hypothetical protein